MTEARLSRLERYEIRERLGAGGMARVYQAWDTHLERLVAIKVLHEHLADDESFKERFEREAKFIASLNHPNIVQVYDYKAAEHEGFPMYYMVMSHIDGKTLRQVLEDALIARQQLTRDQVLRWTRNLCDALGYAHEIGMVHRDVKPGNIILNGRGDVVLTDFGIARMVASSRLTQDGLSTGTPAYMSPEQATGDAGDARSDLYSLGIIVFEMLTGRTPYNDDGTLSLMYKQINAPVPAISQYLQHPNPRLDQFMARALAKNPDERFATAAEFWQALNAILGDSAVDVTAILPTNQLPSAAQKHTTAPRIIQTLSTNPRARSTGIIVIALAALVVIAMILMNANVLNPPAPAPIATLSGNVPSMTGSDTNSMTAGVPSMTGGGYFTSRFNPNSTSDLTYWTQSTDDLFTRELLLEGGYRLSNQRPFIAETSIANLGMGYDNISITLRGTLDPESAPASAFGIVFHYQDDANYNVFALDGLGRYSIWVLETGIWRELRDADEEWTLTEAANPIGERNRLSITVIGSFLTGYINNRQVVRVEDDTFSTGEIGIYFATDAGEATVVLDEYRVFPSVPSMTGSAP